MQTKPAATTNRLISIDALRAIIMLLMIFVNDLWSLKNIPLWLEHVSADADGMGLADIVFPAFLFIVGLSVPFAVESRKRKGDSKAKIILHIFYRTIALLVMGLFFVNMESYQPNGALLPLGAWEILLVISYFLVWLAYPNPKALWVKLCKALGIALMIFLALVFKSDTGNGLAGFEIHWWGILGLIGWAYVSAALIYVFSNGKMAIIIAALLFFVFFNAASFLGWLDGLNIIRPYFWLSGSGAMGTLSLAGVIAALVYKQFGTADKKFWLLMSGYALLLFVFGFATRPLWGISKIRATPSWTTICSGITILLFLLIIFITEIKKITGWFAIIKPAGSSTLTCYLLPYIHYGLIGLFHIPALPLFLRTDGVGLLKSFLYALLIIMITGLLEKKNLKLKI